MKAKTREEKEQGNKGSNGEQRIASRRRRVRGREQHKMAYRSWEDKNISRYAAVWQVQLLFAEFITDLAMLYAAALWGLVTPAP